MDFNYFLKLFSAKHLLTYSIFFCYFSNAVNYSILGPTIKSLSDLYKISIDEMSLIYTVRTFSYTIGALSGFGFNFLNREICLIFFTILMGITIAILPIVTYLPVFFVIGAINGLMAGGSDTAITASIIELWDLKSGPFMNALHFAFGTGSMLAPLIARPFIGTDNLAIAYIICGAICVTAAIVLIIMLLSCRFKTIEVMETNAQNPNQMQSLSDEIIQESERHELNPKLGLVIVALGCALLATYVAMEMTYFSFESTFVQYSRYNVSEADATLLLSTTSAVFTLTRGVEILVSLKISSHSILLIHFVIIIVFNLLAIFTYNLPIIWVWISNIGIGIGCGSVYPTIYSFLQQNFHIDNKKTAILLFVGGVISSLYPFIVGSSIESRPLVLMFVNVISIILCLILLFSIKFLTFKFSPPIKPQQVNTTEEEGYRRTTSVNT